MRLSIFPLTFFVLSVCIASAQSFVTSSPNNAQTVSGQVEQILNLPKGFLEKKYIVSFPVNAGVNAPIIVHIGQVHEDYRGAEHSQEARGEILNNQTRIQQLIQEIAKNNKIGCVFAEGFAQKSPEALLTVRSRREALIQAIDLRAKKTRSFYVKDIDVFEPFITRIKTFRQYNDAEVQVKVYETIVNYLEQRELSQDDMEKVSRARGELEKLYKSYGRFPSVLMSGAVNKLFFDHKIPAVCPAEDLEVNLKAQEVMKRSNALSDRASEAEVQRMLDEQERLVIRERDIAVQQLIRTVPAKYKSKVAVAVFGDAHNWAQVTREANKKSGATAYSYIKITPRAGLTW